VSREHKVLTIMRSAVSPLQSAHQKLSKKFEKPLDKSNTLWYNKGAIREGKP
jgi:hypothetical protein